MKIVFLFIFFWFITGCVAPLNKPTTSQYIAVKEGLRTTDVKQVDYCAFVEAPLTRHSGLWKECILGITEKSIYFYNGDIKKINLDEALKVSFNNIKAVDLSKFVRTVELHILLEDRLVGLQITKNRAFVDTETVKSLYYKLLSKGIPEFDSGGAIGDTGRVIYF